MWFAEALQVLLRNVIPTVLVQLMKETFVLTGAGVNTYAQGTAFLFEGKVYVSLWCCYLGSSPVPELSSA
jgi:hypothetical protein